MGRLSAPLLALALGAVTALGLLACGGGSDADLLPGGTASEINSNLDRVQELVAAGECIGAEDAAEEVSTQVEDLTGVDERLQQALREGAARLNEVVIGCEETVTEETVPSIEPAEEPEEGEEKQKPKKPEKPKEDEELPEEADTAPTLPPQAEGKAKGHEEEEVPPVEPEGGTPSGGVGPGEPAPGDEAEGDG